MSALVTDYTYGTTERGVNLANGQIFARLDPSLVGSWSNLVVGMRFFMTGDTGAAPGSANYWFGLSSGAAAGIGDATPAHCVGWGNRTITGTQQTINARTVVSTNWFYYGTSSGTYFGKIVNGTWTAASSFATYNRFPGILPGAGSIRQGVIFLYFKRGTPNWNVACLAPTTVNVNCSSAVFREMVQSCWHFPTPSSDTLDGCGTYYNDTSLRTLAVDEATDGTLDYVNLWWDTAAPSLVVLDLCAYEITP